MIQIYGSQGKEALFVGVSKLEVCEAGLWMAIFLAIQRDPVLQNEAR